MANLTAPARRPWWKKRRWIAGPALWLAVVYPLSAGPATYARGRGWISPQWATTLYRPAAWAAFRFGASGLRG